MGVLEVYSHIYYQVIMAAVAWVQAQPPNRIILSIGHAHS